MSNLCREVLLDCTAMICTILASVYDVRKRKIPNILTGMSIVIALVLHLALMGWMDLATSALAGIVSGGFLFLFYLAGGIGAGDVKLMSAIGCFIGFHSILLLLFVTTLCGAALGLIVAIRKKMLRRVARNSILLIQHHHAHGLTPHQTLNINNTAILHMPFAVPIMAGCLITSCVQMWSL